VPSWCTSAYCLPIVRDIAAALSCHNILVMQPALALTLLAAKLIAKMLQLSCSLVYKLHDADSSCQPRTKCKNSTTQACMRKPVVPTCIMRIVFAWPAAAHVRCYSRRVVRHCQVHLELWTAQKA
jgi:hypothetical protein